MELPQPSSVEENKSYIVKIASNAEVFCALAMLLGQSVLTYPLILIHFINSAVFDFPMKTFARDSKRWDRLEIRQLVLDLLIFATLLITFDLDMFGDKATAERLAAAEVAAKEASIKEKKKAN